MNVQLEVAPANEGPLAAFTVAPVMRANGLDVRLEKTRGFASRFDLRVEIDSGAFVVASEAVGSEDRKRIEILVREKIIQANRYASIHYKGKVEIVDEARGLAQVSGQLTLRGKSVSLAFEVNRVSVRRWEGRFSILQTDFGITPVVAFLGSLRSRDRIDARVSIETELPG